LVGTSRTGGRFARRWQFNALKEILKAATSLDVKTAHSDGDSADFDACLAAPPCLLKTHAFVPRLLPLVDAARGPRRNRRNRRNTKHTQVFTSHRDLRDVLLSSMQMFGSCLGFGPEGLHSRDAAGSAAAHDVAPRFQQYAKWVPFACYDMAYERMYGDRPGEVDRLAAALGVALCGNQPVEWTRPAKLQTSLSRSNRSRFG
jgi:hypothetical protein